ncbi:hypothetical protein NDR87_27620 [Nocardia sp. CDC159]|uniref:Uncharacterized protein n=1 Tax=Nocardia pulmonis TaxID=2951408 RepID=A0A9X2EBH4_9NOCA|nr:MULTISPECIES: hypothetical protein [Nocardia]MCM6777261.1 hypothetical protein [Nocardia pulmonis]MCM6790146.1 hypothetical protein [Nocardia sp. CDC159]
MSDRLYIDRAAVRELVALLREIPDLAMDLLDATTRQARLGHRERRWQHHSGAQPLPYNPAAAAAADRLHAALVSWVRHVCEHRGLVYAGPTTTGGLARWLDRHLIALAMTPGVEAAPAEFRMVVTAATRIVCPPATVIELDTTKLALARRSRLNASGIAMLAKELGEQYRGLTVRRIQTLRDAGRIAPVPGPWAPDWPDQYVVGDVLDAHLVHPLRCRRTATTESASKQPTVGIEVRRAG